MTRILTTVIKGILEQMKVKENEKVILLTTREIDPTSPNIAEHWFDALTESGAQSLRITVPSVEKNGKLVSSVQNREFDHQILKQADLIINLQVKFPGNIPKPINIYSDEFNDILRGGTRWQDVMMNHPETNYRRLYPRDEIIKKTQEGAKLMQEAKTIRITSKHGTDMTMDKTGRKAMACIGVANEPGRWENLGNGLVCCAPIEDSANGNMVIMPGDVFPHEGVDLLEIREPVKIKVKDGKIKSIEGGLEAGIIRKHLASKDEDAYSISGHIGWGTQDAAVLPNSKYFTTPDYEGYSGNMQNHWGKNIFDAPAKYNGFAGLNRSNGHGGPSCLNNTFYLDDEIIVNEGELVHDKCK